MNPTLLQLIPLFEDPDPVVEEAVNKAMLKMGEEVVDDLYTLYYKEKRDKNIKRAILNKIYFLNSEFTLEEVESYVISPDPDLKYGIYLLCKLFNPNLKLYDFNTLIFSLADDMIKEISDNNTAFERVSLFNHIFYSRLKFKCCDTLMSNEKSAHILKVLENRSGNPIAMSIVYFLLARCAGITIVPLCFPSGFIPIYLDNDGKPLFFINIFKDGDIFSEEKLQGFFKAQGLDFKPSEFHVRNDKTLLVMYLESLMFLYSSKNNHEMMDLVNRALQLFGEERFLLSDDSEE